jgi:hypothetical protein
MAVQLVVTTEAWLRQLLAGGSGDDGDGKGDGKGDGDDDGEGA